MASFYPIYRGCGVSGPTWDDKNSCNRMVGAFRNAVLMLPKGHKYLWCFLAHLAVGLDIRFRQLGEVEDLDEMIALHRGVLELHPPDKEAWLSDLAATLQLRFIRRESMTDLHEAIERHREALELRPPGHPERILSLGSLANALWTRFELTGKSQDMVEASELRGQMIGLPSSEAYPFIDVPLPLLSFITSMSTAPLDSDVLPGISALNCRLLIMPFLVSGIPSIIGRLFF
jgi:hypothetical protein